MTIYSIIAGSFNGLIALILAVYIFAKNFRSRLNQIFGLFYSFIAIWSFNYALFNVSIYQNDPIKTISGQRWAAFGYIPIAVLFYHFVLVFTGPAGSKEKITDFWLPIRFFLYMAGSCSQSLFFLFSHRRFSALV